LDTTNCFLCDLKFENVKDYQESGLNIIITCRNCGQYVIHKEIIQLLSKNDFQNKKFILSGLIREYTDEHFEPFEITQSVIDDLIPHVSVPSDLFEQMDKILMYLYKQTTYKGKLIEIMDVEYAIAYAKNIEEFRFLLAKLIELNYIETEKDKYRLSLEGWKRISEIKKINRKSDQCFIAMWFPKDNSMVPFEVGAKLALKKTGHIPFVVKDFEHNDKICDKIIAEIRKSAFMIADFTGHRNNVYFEAGYAKGLGIPVVFTCRDTDFEKIKEQFDTRQYSHIKWTDSEDLEKKLLNRIEATISIR
jgi:nucleoside 2-deoxyribosyltransferase